MTARAPPRLAGDDRRRAASEFRLAGNDRPRAAPNFVATEYSLRFRISSRVATSARAELRGRGARVIRRCLGLLAKRRPRRMERFAALDEHLAELGVDAARDGGFRPVCLVVGLAPTATRVDREREECTAATVVLRLLVEQTHAARGWR